MLLTSSWLAVGVAVQVWVSVVTAVVLYYRTLPLAGLVLLPSAVWITAATALVTSIWSLNGREPLYPFKKTAGSGQDDAEQL